MIDFLSLVSSTSAYKILKNDKEKERLSHAYLIVCSDQVYLREYVKIMAKVILCSNENPCGVCRACNLVDKEQSADVMFFPKNKESVLTEDINLLIEESYIKPVKSDKKLFIIDKGETMTTQAQNKLLKTLEEPPQNVIILIGATSEYPILKTVQSRVKKLEIPFFSDEKLFSALENEFIDQQKLIDAIECSDKTVGGTERLYKDENLEKTMEIVTDTLINMNSSREILDFSTKILSEKIKVDEFLSVLSVILCGLIKTFDGVKTNSYAERVKSLGKNFTRGAVIHALEKTAEAVKKRTFNVSESSVLEWLLFQILEGKFKWQKL